MQVYVCLWSERRQYDSKVYKENTKMKNMHY